MANVKNIKKYRKIFINLSADPNNSFAKYLEDNNLTLINFLLDLGLNKELVQTFNYEELKHLSSTVLNVARFPKFSFPMGNEVTENDTVSLYNDTQKNLKIYPEGIAFSDSFIEDKEEFENRTYILAKYLLVGDLIRSNLVEIIASHNKEDDYYIHRLKIKANEIDNAKNGDVVKERNIEIDINCRLGSNLYSHILGSVNHNSINSIVGKINELIKEGKLNQEDVKFSQGDVGLKF